MATNVSIKVGDGLRSRKGAYDYKVTAVAAGVVTMKWIGPEKPGYSYRRKTKLDGIEKAYTTFEIAASYTTNGEWRGRETYAEHRAAMTVAKVEAPVEPAKVDAES